MISELAPAKVIVPQTPGAGAVTVDPGGIWEWGWQLNERLENSALVLLAQNVQMSSDASASEIVFDGLDQDAGIFYGFTAASRPHRPDLRHGLHAL